MVHHKVCPLCSSENIGLLFRCYDYFLSKKEFPVYKCAECNFSFTQDYPGEQEIGQFYESDDYISPSDTSKGLTNKLYRITRNAMLRRKRNIIYSATGLKTGTILDIGSGTGYFAGTMKDAGWDVKGIEISEKARKFSIAHFGVDIIPPGEISVLGSESFDCITLWHVLEHFHDPFKYVSEITRMMKPDATCIIALPNCGSYDAEYYKQFWAALDVPRHLWHFHPESFRLFCEKSGLELKELKILPLDVFYISQLSEKYKGSSLPFLRGISKAFIFAFLSAFHPERGSSIVYILRKSKS
jgi:2-polyprenyl-3-methyl-5-hydroxy-6-metoxy-1,4-benzoquinol methylase